MANSRLCSIPDCGKMHLAKGFCATHYQRMRHHGDPLGGGPQKTEDGEPMRFIEEVALSCTQEDCLPWPYSRDGNGYGKVLVDGKLTSVSRYVCERTHGPAPTSKHETAHSCGKGHLGCINPHHLVWKTHAENVADKLVHDTHNRGERNHQAKLSEEEVRGILSLKGVKTLIEIADYYGVTFQTVSLIHRGKRWAWLTS